MMPPQTPPPDLPTIYLKPGEAHLGYAPARVVTVLGSCVAVIMYHRGQRLGAICHAVMPSLTEARTTTGRPQDAYQYVDSSIETMLTFFDQRGIKRREIEVKIFGGAALFAGSRAAAPAVAVGPRNVETALAVIKANALNLKAWNVGGHRGRKVIFYTETGEVFTKFVAPNEGLVSIQGQGRKA